MSELAIVALQSKGTSYDLCLSTVSTALCSESTLWDPNSSQLSVQRPFILYNMLIIMDLVSNHYPPSSEFERALSMVGLAMIVHATTPLGEAARQFFVLVTQEAILQKHIDMWVPLGLCGIVRALESDHLLEYIQASDLLSVFHLLWRYLREGSPLDELPSHIVDNIDVKRCVTETAFDCHQRLSGWNTRVWTLDTVLGLMLQRGDKLWVAPIVAALIEQTISDHLKEDCVGCIAYSEPRPTGIGTPLLTSAFCEAVRLEVPFRRESNDDALRLTEHFGNISNIAGQDEQTVVHAVLQRLLDDNMFRSLLVLMAKGQLLGTTRHWRGIKAGYVVRFWGDHIIRWGRKILQESESNDRAQKIQEFFTNEEALRNRCGTVEESAMDLKILLWRIIRQ